MKKLFIAAVIGVIVGAYGTTHEDEPIIETSISASIEYGHPVTVLEVYHDDKNSEISPGDFRALFNKVTSSWEQCGVVFELTSDPKAPIHIGWKSELETGEDSFAESDHCGANNQTSDVTLAIGKFTELTYSQQSDTLAHELGHILCVPHSTNERSLMYDTTLGTKQKLMPEDVKQCIDNLPNLYKEEQ